MSRVLQCFLNSDLRLGHEGLAALAQNSGVDIKSLEPGEYVLFINSHKNKLKLYAAHDVVAYLRLPSGERMNLSTIQLIPKAFQGSGKINYNEALKQVVLEALARKRS